jgi:hypothetical protein
MSQLVVTPTLVEFDQAPKGSVEFIEVSATGAGSFTAVTSDDRIAIVTPKTQIGAGPFTFKITPRGTGSCIITVTDDVSDTQNVNITVVRPFMPDKLQSDYVLVGTDLVAEGSNLVHSGYGAASNDAARLDALGEIENDKIHRLKNIP